MPCSLLNLKCLQFAKTVLYSLYIHTQQAVNGHILSQSDFSNLNKNILEGKMDKFPLTKNGYIALEAELKNLKGVERPNVIAAIAEARSHGDLSENAEYSAAKEKQSFIEGRIQELEAVISRAQVIDPSQTKTDVIRFGATVVVVDEDTDEEKKYQIVGDYEADIEKNLISLSSPLAKALIGKEAGDVAEFSAPGGRKSFEIVDVIYQ